MWPQSQETQELLAEARAGDSAAVNRLLERHRAALRRMKQIAEGFQVFRRGPFVSHALDPADSRSYRKRRDVFGRRDLWIGPMSGE